MVPKALVTVKGVLNSAMDARYLRHLKGESTIMELFAPQFYLMTREHSAIQLTPRCLPEVRLGIKGTVVVAGVSLSVLAGDTLREKTAAMEQLTIDGFLKLAERAGFVAVLEPGQAVVTPAAFLVCYFNLGTETAEGLRWSFLDEQTEVEVRKVSEALDLYLQDHPVSASDVLHKLKDILAAD